MDPTATRLAAAVAGYARRLHDVAGADHHVGSALGAWLLLALCAPASTGPARAELAGVLGLDVDEAAGLAAALLANPHPVVLSAAAVWTRLDEIVGGGRGAEGAAWLDRLPPAVDRGEIPAQPELDEWARRHTLGLIEQFPLRVDPSTLLVLATALATKVSWLEPFEEAPAAALGPGSAWSGRLSTVLRSPTGFAHIQYIAGTAGLADTAGTAGLADTAGTAGAEAAGTAGLRGTAGTAGAEGIGDVAVHTAMAQDGLAVTSVIAPPDVPAAEVLAVAYRLASAQASHRPVARRSLFDLPLGDTPLWTITEEPVRTSARDGREEVYRTLMPAWSASSDLDLSGPRLGFGVAAQALGAAFELADYAYAAKQAAVARYSREGFEAAAVTGMAMAAGLPELRDGRRRYAELRFAHPYAVVAVATQGGYAGNPPAGGPWHGVPVFAAWVADVA